MSIILFGNYIKQGLVYYPLPYMELAPQYLCYSHVTAAWEVCEAGRVLRKALYLMEVQLR